MVAEERGHVCLLHLPSQMKKRHDTYTITPTVNYKYFWWFILKQQCNSWDLLRKGRQFLLY
jgi:hypothetical protein